MVGPERQALDRSPNNYAASRLQSPINRSIIHATFLFSPHYHHASIHYTSSLFQFSSTSCPPSSSRVACTDVPRSPPVTNRRASPQLTTHYSLVASILLYVYTISPLFSESLLCRWIMYRTIQTIITVFHSATA
jgi:hypothetical protein